MIGTTELMAIIVAALFLFGPQKLPELARSLGGAMGEFKKAQRAAELGLTQFDAYTQKAGSTATPGEKENMTTPGEKEKELKDVSGSSKEVSSKEVSEEANSNEISSKEVSKEVDSNEISSKEVKTDTDLKT